MYPVFYAFVDDTIPIPFPTYDGGTGASITMTGLAVTDIEIYKAGGTTQRASDNGYTLLDTDGIDFDGITGVHGFSVDLSDNSDASFYAAGSWYWVVVSTITVDAQTVSFIAGMIYILPTERGFAGTALPAAVADAAGGLPISDAGALDLDALNTAAVRLTAARAQVLDDWVNGGRLDLILDAGATAAALATVDTVVDAIKLVTDLLPNAGALSDLAAILTDTGTTLPALLATIDTVVDAIKAVTDLLPNSGALSDLGTIEGRMVGITLFAEWLGAMAGKQTANATALTEIQASGAGSGTFSETTDALEALRDNQGGGGGATQREVVGSVSGSGTTCTIQFHLLVDGILAADTALSLPVITEVYALDGTPLGWAGSVAIVAPGLVHATGTITAPTVNQPVTAKVQVTHGAVVRDGICRGIVLAA